MLTLREITKAVGGIAKNISPDSEVSEFYVDSRAVKPHSVFFSLKGEKFDGANFAEEAISQGAEAVIVPFGAKIPATIPHIRVDDTILAMGRLAAYRVSKLKAKIIGITGSVGKTTTKELVFTLLSSRYSVFKSKKSFNNHIGLPLTILEAPPHSDFIILEYGTNHSGEISYLTSIARPDLALITRVGSAHIEFFGNIENIAREKTILFRDLKYDGTAFLNAEAPYFDLLNSRVPYTARRVTFGITKGEVRPEHAKFSPLNTEFTYKGHEFIFPYPGRGMLENAIAAIAIAEYLGIPPTDMVNIIKDFKDERMRMERIEIKGITFINDSYNSNPDSLAEVLRTFKEGGNRLIFIIGDMLELGEYAENEHKRMGKIFVEEKHKNLITVGNLSKVISEEVKKAGIEEAYHFNSKDEAVEFLKTYIKPGDYVILKASRALAFEEILNKLEAIL